MFDKKAAGSGDDYSSNNGETDQTIYVTLMTPGESSVAVARRGVASGGRRKFDWDFLDGETGHDKDVIYLQQDIADLEKYLAGNEGEQLSREDWEFIHAHLERRKEQLAAALVSKGDATERMPAQRKDSVPPDSGVRRFFKLLGF